jgi:hypothetical protein
VKRLLVCAVLAALSLVPVPSADAQQMPPGKWWRRPELVRELKLNQEQQDRLDEVFRTHANDLIDTRGEIEKIHIALRGELDRAQLRRTELQRLATQLTTARGRLFERELMMLVDMRGVLQEEQWSKLRRVLDQHEERRGEGRPPMMGRPGEGRRGPGGRKP